MSKKECDARYCATHKVAIAANKKAWREANKEVCAAYAAGYNAAHKEVRAAYKAGWYEAHKEANKAEKAANAAKWYAENKAEVAASGALYRATHKTETAARAAAWRTNNPDKVQAGHARRRSLKLGAESDGSTLKDLIALFGNQCLCCGNGVALTVDHVIPLSRGGSDKLDNKQPLCLSCNDSKSTKTVDYRVKETIWR